MTQFFDRSKLKNGDLLVWHKTSSGKKLFNALEIVRILTSSEFGHASVVWIKDGNPWHVEATMPYVRLMPISSNAEVFVVPMNLEAGEVALASFYYDKIGLSYSRIDALCALMGWTVRADDRWQCAELCLAFYRYMGLMIPDAFTPGRLVLEILKSQDTYLRKLSL